MFLNKSNWNLKYQENYKTSRKTNKFEKTEIWKNMKFKKNQRNGNSPKILSEPNKLGKYYHYHKREMDGNFNAHVTLFCWSTMAYLFSSRMGLR
jgi:hypothetical protein